MLWNADLTRSDQGAVPWGTGERGSGGGHGPRRVRAALVPATDVAGARALPIDTTTLVRAALEGRSESLAKAPLAVMKLFPSSLLSIDEAHGAAEKKGKRYPSDALPKRPSDTGGAV